MADLHVEIPDPLDSKFRQAIARHLGGKKGDLGRAIEEAVEDWIKKVEHSK